MQELQLSPVKWPWTNRVEFGYHKARRVLIDGTSLYPIPSKNAIPIESR
jgi:hypothetical protein